MGVGAEQQEIVLIAGPHKTASSTTQKTLITLQQANSLSPYVWPRRFRHSKKKPYNQKQFSKFVTAVIARSPSKILKYYIKEMGMIWSKGQSIVIGAELLGPASLSSSGSELLDGLEELYSKVQTTQNKAKVSRTVVLNFRSERLGHLVSVWNQFLYKAKTNDISFSDWMCSMDCSLPDIKLNLNVVNTLGQAAVYRKANYSVVVVDSGGVERDGLNLANVPACEVLGLECIDGIPKNLKDFKKQGVRRKSIADISESVSREINEILKRMDCSYKDFLEDKNVRILHLSDMFSNCSTSSDESSVFNEKHACSQIQNVIGCSHNKTTKHNEDDGEQNRVDDHINNRVDDMVNNRVDDQWVEMNDSDDENDGLDLVFSVDLEKSRDVSTDLSSDTRLVEAMSVENRRLSRINAINVCVLLPIVVSFLYYRSKIRKLCFASKKKIFPSVTKEG